MAGSVCFFTHKLGYKQLENRWILFTRNTSLEIEAHPQISRGTFPLSRYKSAISKQQGDGDFLIVFRRATQGYLPLCEVLGHVKPCSPEHVT